MWKKIKSWFVKNLDLDKDGKVSSKDLEIARSIADKNTKAANEIINEVVQTAGAVKKVVKDRKKK